MSSLLGLLNIAGSGLAAQTAAIDATGQNVANVNTPGYSRVTANLETTATGDTFSGTVQANGVVRSYNQFTYGNLLSEQGKGGAADARSQALNQVQSVMAPGSGTIADSVNAFFTSATTLGGSPSDPSARAVMLQSATTLAQSISGTAAGLSSERSSLLTQAQGVATDLNGELSQIAKLNGQIASATAQGSQPTDLQDRRDALVSKVSTQIGAQAIQDSKGNYTLLSSGVALVTGNQASAVSVGVDASGKMQVAANQPGGATIDITANTNAGSLGGLREARDTDLAAASSQLDQFASNLATAVNAVQSSGYGLDGVTGRNLFTQPATVAGAAASFAVDPQVVGNPQFLAASSTAAGLPGGNDVAVKLSQLASQSLSGGPPPAQAFGALAASVGVAASAAISESETRTETVTQAKDLNDSSSGVSLDEEMANMTAFQNAYAASAKVIQTAETLLNTLMQML
jgi:flagellar hook-associated protein 1 FlgK